MALPIRGEFPNVSRAFRGWTRKRAVQVVTQTIDELTGLADRTVVNLRRPVLIQPMPAREVERKREDQQSWGWWTVWVRGLELNVDDALVVDGKPYLIESVSNWVGGGYREYKAHENWTGELPPPPDPGGST